MALGEEGSDAGLGGWREVFLRERRDGAVTEGTPRLDRANEQKT